MKLLPWKPGKHGILRGALHEFGYVRVPGFDADDEKYEYLLQEEPDNTTEQFKVSISLRRAGDFGAVGFYRWNEQGSTRILYKLARVTSRQQATELVASGYLDPETGFLSEE